jgi:NADPH:quinone reductase-like Zn-dependent oxidoreductase/short-subunit dehydrogenase/acyl carrier protein/SAM-dependent methyltransferase
MNKAVLGISAKIAQAWPANRRLRMLLVGDGGLVLMRGLLPFLPEGRSDVVIAARDEDVRSRAEAEFAGQGWVSVALIDQETFAFSEGTIADRDFDVILTAHAMHRSSDPLLTLSGLKAHLAKGGLLLQLERHPDRLAHFTDGLNADWWQDGGARLTSPETWHGLLQETGYAEVEMITEPRAGDLEAGAYILLAKNPDARVTPRAEIPPAHWLLLTDAEGDARAFAASLAQRLAEQGQVVSLAEANRVPTDIAPFDHVVHLAGLAASETGPDMDPLASQGKRCLALLDFIQALEPSPARQPPRLWLLTAGGAVATTSDGKQTFGHPNPAQSALWGFGRVIMNEHPELRCRLIDLQAGLDEAMASRLGEELLRPDGEDEILLTADSRHALRMQPLAATQSQPKKDAAFQNVCLDFVVPGQLRNLQWHAAPLRELATGEIEIQPKATGLNFRDVMYAMGLLSDEAVENGFAGPTMGMELSGVVTRIGAAVTDFKPGDPVIAFAPAGFAKRAVTQAASAVRKPDGWSFEEAATVPTVFFTVYYALHHLARLQPGEKVLIHGAAGGVGIAAIQLARHLGAEIFATAGSEEKRDFLRLLGADHVMNSRSLAFADEILDITGGRGIDVVLNSLAGEAINRNLRVLRPFGRFLELGKRDFYENTRIGLRPFKDNITYYGIDADQLMVERPDLTSRLFKEMMALFEQGILKPLPYRTFPASRVVEAFRYMQQSKQIGKILVSFEDSGVPVPAASTRPNTMTLSRDATYLVTGGVGGFGLKTAKWLAEHGAGHLVLLSRRGPQAPEADQAAAALRSAGAKVHIMACDVSDADQLRTVIAEIDRDLPPLKGIVHAAMVLDDGLIRNLDRERFEKVLRPKILGAWNLHRFTRHLPLDLFVLYSSATTFIGNPGQANYVAANLYLEGLAAHRRAQGLKATAVCWGAIADVGYLARHGDIKDALESRLGGAALASDPALAQLGEMIAANRSGVAVMDLDFHSIGRFLPAMASPRFDELRRLASTASLGSGGEDIHTLLANRSEAEVREILQHLLTEEIAQILRLPADRIPLDRSLYDIGMDSLMGVELVLGVEKRFGISLPVMALSEGPTISRITERLVQQLLGPKAEASTDEDTRLKEVMEGMALQHGVEASEGDIEQALADLKSEKRLADGTGA